MAIVRRVRRLVNPRGGTTRRRKRARSPKHRRKLSAAQIAAGFGGRRRKAASKAHARLRLGNPRRRRKARAANPSPHRRRVRVVYRTRTKYKTRTRTIVKRVRAKSNPRKHKRRARRTNPVLVTFGPALNPRRKRSKNPVAKRRRRRSNPSRHHTVRHRRRRMRMSNPRVRVVYRTRRRSRRHMNSRRRRNPVSFAGAKDMAVAVVAGLAGVTVTKLAASAASSFTASSPILNVVVSGVAAWGAGELAKMAMGKEIGHAVAFGGYMQAGSVALNTFLPSIGSVIGLSGMRGLTPSHDILLPYNMFDGMGARTTAGATRSPGGGTGFAPAFA